LFTFCHDDCAVIAIALHLDQDALILMIFGESC